MSIGLISGFGTLLGGGMTEEVLDRVEEGVPALAIKLMVERRRTTVVDRDADGVETTHFEWSFYIRILNLGAARRFRVILSKDVGRSVPPPRQTYFEYTLDFPTISPKSMEGVRHQVKGDDRDRYRIARVQVLDGDRAGAEQAVHLELGAGHKENRLWTFATVLTLPFTILFLLWKQLFAAPWSQKPVFLIFCLLSPVVFVACCMLTILILPPYTIARIFGLIGRKDKG